jgi:hypothetical protein
MSQTESKMQPTIHLQSKRGYFPRPYPVIRDIQSISLNIKMMGYWLSELFIFVILVMMVLGDRFTNVIQFKLLQ